MHPNSINNIVDVSNLDDRAETREERDKTRREWEKLFQYLLSAPQDVLGEDKDCFESL